LKWRAVFNLEAQSENDAPPRDQAGRNANRFASVVCTTFEASRRGNLEGGVFSKSDRRGSFHQLIRRATTMPRFR